MAGELFRVRSKFLESVSGPVLSQLLDDILEDHIVNDAERESIEETNNTRRAKASCLLDTVRRKGDASSWKMIARIQVRDPNLFAELGLSLPAQRPQMTNRSDGWSATLKLSTKEFWMQKQAQRDVYPVSIHNARNRVALLITNIKFKMAKLYRDGAEKDEENMEALLKALGYEVEKHTNLTAKAIDQALIQFSKHKKVRETDSVVVCIMSHGKRGIILGVDWHPDDQTPDEFPIDNIFTHLGSANCPALINKPKIVIIQACRGVESGSVLVSNVASDDHTAMDVDDVQADDVLIAHKEKDFIALLSCTPDTISYRQPGLGSFLIRFAVQVLNTWACEEDVEELFRKVMQRFEDFPISNKRQMPTKDRCTLTKRFYFFPGLGDI